MSDVKNPITEVEAVDAFAPIPRRKADKVVAGRLSTWNEEGACVFQANKERPELKREILHDKGGVRLAKTQGEKESSIILTCKVDADSPDPVGDILSKAYDQLKSKAKKVPQIPNANFLIDDPDKLRVWHRRDKKQLCMFVVLDTSRDTKFISEELMQAMTKVNSVINRKF